MIDLIAFIGPFDFVVGVLGAKYFNRPKNKSLFTSKFLVQPEVECIDKKISSRYIGMVLKPLIDIYIKFVLR